MLAPMDDLTQLEAESALQAVEALLGDMMACKDVEAFKAMGEAVAKAMSSGRYPKTLLFMTMHQMNYPRIAEMFGVLIGAAIRARKLSGSGAVQ